MNSKSTPIEVSCCDLVMRSRYHSDTSCDFAVIAFVCWARTANYGNREKRTTSILVGPARSKEVIATLWVLEGKKIPFNDMVFSVQTDLNVLNAFMKKLKDFHKTQVERATRQNDAKAKEHLEGLAQQLKKVDRFLAKAEDKVQLQSTLPEKGDEPIFRIIQTMGITPISHPGATTNKMWEDQTVHFRLGNSLSASAAPLTKETNRGKQIRKRDTVLMLGSFVAIVVSKKEKTIEKIVNFLKLTNLQRPEDESDGENDSHGESEDKEDVWHTTSLDIEKSFGYQDY
ncbi:hypothetical protein BDZ45DRAFT_753798 [Acephala macrosclerotiorum]|nr:hypothetical protein BDZ45DRAFT_753798 [Acephala macrosclerotiorum]